MSPTERSRQLERLFAVWWPHLRDVVCAIAGLYFLWHEVVVVDEADVAILGLGGLLLGITGSGLAQRILDREKAP